MSTENWTCPRCGIINTDNIEATPVPCCENCARDYQWGEEDLFVDREMLGDDAEVFAPGTIGNK